MKFRVALLVLSIFVALVTATSAVAQPPELKFVEPEKLAVNYDGEKSGDTSVWIKNTGPAPVTPEFSTILQESNGLRVDVEVEVIDEGSAPVKPATIAAGGVKRYRIRFANPSKGSGQLVASAKDVAAATLPLSLGKELPPTRGVNATLAIGLVLALIALIPAWLRGHGEAGLGDRLGGTAELDFTKSFASTITGVGALLGTIIAATEVLPEETVELSKAGFIGLNLTFAIAVAIAAAISTSVLHAKATKAEKATDPPVWKTEGYVFPYLIAAFITLWAVFGELGTIWLLVGELASGKGFTSVGVWGLRVLLVVAGLAMFPYTYNRLKVAVAKPEAKDEDGEAIAPADLPEAEPEAEVALL